MDLKKDRRMGSGNKQGSIPDSFKEWIKFQELVDIWSYCNGDRKDYICYSARHKTYSRIDYAFVSRSFANHTMTTKVGAQIYAHHAQVLVTWKNRGLLHFVGD